MQLDIILTSLQDHTHVASLLGYSSPTDGPEVLSSGPGFTGPLDPTYGNMADHPDTHLAEILMKTLLRNLGFYTVSGEFDTSRCCSDRNKSAARSSAALLCSFGLSENTHTQNHDHKFSSFDV